MGYSRFAPAFPLGVLNNVAAVSISQRPPGSFHDAVFAFGEDAAPVVDVLVSNVTVGAVVLVATSVTAVAVVLGIVNHVNGLL
jgi:hypothetical protein